MTIRSNLLKINELFYFLQKKLPKSYRISKIDERSFSDIAIYRNDALYAIFQTENTSSKFKDLELEKSKALFERVESCQFFITIKKDGFYVVEKKYGECVEYEEEKTLDVVNKIITSKQLYRYENVYDGIVEYLTKVHLSEIANRILRHEDGFCYLDEDDTDYFFNALLSPSNPIQSVYRYTSLSTLFEIVKNKSYRLNCIVGMNDPTEIDYFEDYIGLDYFRYQHEEKNDIFISSCSTLADDLTMWRLYGDNAKGVCIEFNVQGTDYGYIKNIVSYANKNKKNEKLDIVKNLIRLGLDLRGLEKWKHFFKPCEYRIEEEYRVLLTKRSNDNDEKRNWIITSDNSILNPVYDISLFEKPISIKRIFLGPKCPEKEINRRQLKVMMREKGIEGIDVCFSTIKNYR